MKNFIQRCHTFFVKYQCFAIPLIIILYVVILSVQLNIRPLERYPEWDHFWADTRLAGTLETLKLALQQGELPFIVPYTSFGWNLVGNHYSFFSPTYFLILFFDAATVMMITQFLYISLAALGAFYFLRRITQKTMIALYGGILYVSIPFIISVYQFQGTYYNFYHIPFFLFLLHRLLERLTPLRLFIFTAYSVLIVASTDIYTFLIFPVVALLYTFICARWYYYFSFFRTFRWSISVSALFLLAGSFHIVPLLQNLKFINWNSVFQEAGIISSSSLGKAGGFLSFFLENGFESLFIPYEGSGLLLYIPFFFYLAIAVVIGTYFMYRKWYDENTKKQLVIICALLLIGVVMFFESVVLYSSFFQQVLSSIAPGSSDAVRGKLRVQINVIPFACLFAGLISFSIINELRRKKILYLIYGFIGVLSLMADYAFYLIFWETKHLFYSDNMYQVVEFLLRKEFLQTTRIPFYFPAILQASIFANLVLLAIFFLIWHGEKSLRLKKAVVKGIYFVLLFLTPLVSISFIIAGLNFQDNVNKSKLRSSYRWDSFYKNFNTCLKGISLDPNYRTLYASEGNVNPQSGRDWKFIAPTELHVADKRKILISYREFEDGYTALLMNALSDFQTGWQGSNLFPPLTRDILSHTPLLHLMGVRFVISAHTYISDPQFKKILECKLVGTGPIKPNMKERADGQLYGYLLDPSRGITFFARKYEIRSQVQALKELAQGKRFPWDEGVVYIEKEPSPEFEYRAEGVAQLPPREFSKITKETFNSFSVRTNAREKKFLVVSYLYHPEWKAFMDLDKNSMEIYRAYGGFMAIRVPEGDHTIIFRYSTPYPGIGLLLTTIAFFPSIGMIVAERRKKYVV